MAHFNIYSEREKITKNEKSLSVGIALYETVSQRI